MTGENKAPSRRLGAADGNGGAGAVVSVRDYSTSAPESQDFVRNSLRALLDSDEAVEPGDYNGPWADELRALISVHRAGGRAAARRAFDALAKAHPALATLVAGDVQGDKRLLSWSELLAAQFPEPTWVVPSLLPVGLTFLAGRPKLGKSWLALQLAQAVATGGVALDIRVERGSVLYLALEDSWRRIRERGKLQGMPADADVVFADRWQSLEQGGLASLQTEMERRRVRLVVIDTFARVAGRADQQDIAEMTVILSNLQRAALDCDAAILAVDHHRKAGGFSANAIDDILGSTAKSAVSDAVWGLYREQGAHEATLHILGRDVEEQELALRFDGLTMCWQLLGEAGAVRKDTLQDEICRAIRDLERMGETPTTTRISAHTQQHKGNVSRALAELVGRGVVVKAAKCGREQPYTLARSK